jgi:hypothetical protein
MEMVTFTPELFYSWEKSLRDLLNSSLFGPICDLEIGKEKNFVPLPGVEL